MTNNATQNFPTHLPDKNAETVEKDVRKWVESICEFKANLEMEKCDLPSKKQPKKVKKLKVKKRLTTQSAPKDEVKHSKREQKAPKPKPKKEAVKEKPSKETSPAQPPSVFDILRNNFKKAKLPPNWVSGQSRGRLIFCRVKVSTHGSQYEMVSDRGVAITNDCMVHVFVDGPEITLNNWKMQKVETIEDIRKTIKAVDGFKLCSGAQTSGMKNPSCSVLLTGDSKTCQACKSDASQVKVPPAKVKANVKTTPKGSSLPK
ncbi:UNVERIFIED_CONTAM: hypothetical protein PYX00_003464 [Menopon gallinae]|uniref:Uncharacterized protein n=1 Tax=Menopon gallinae TaxID=328185 RepID=A0AAW2I159_9NEOP